MTDHAGYEKKQRHDDDLCGSLRENHGSAQDEDSQSKERIKDLAAVPAGMIETQNETQEIKGEWHDPEKGHGNNFLAELIGGGQEKC